MECIICGGPGLTEFCEKHFLERNHLFSIPEMAFGFCKMCGLYYDGKWKGNEIRLKEFIKSKITEENITKKEVSFRVVGNNMFVKVTCTGIIEPAKTPKTESIEALVKVKKNLCDLCVKRSGGYYEAKIQIRGENADKILEKIGVKTGVERSEHGYDVKFTFKGEAMRAANQLKKKYDVRESKKLVTVKKGRALYRYFYAVR